MLISIEHPSLRSILEPFPGGLWPVPLPAPKRSFLIIKASKEVILTAKIRSGFRIYFVPSPGEADEGRICGLVTAFFDDHDEPLTIWSPLFEDTQIEGFYQLLSLGEFDVYFFDELNREIIGYSAANVQFEQTIQNRAQFSPADFSLESARDCLDFMPKWFGVRTTVEDDVALRIDFVEALYPEDICYFGLEELPKREQGQAMPFHTMLERTKPGTLQELDIAKLLRRTFPVEQIFLNPFREDQNTEFVDVLIIAEHSIILIQAKDSPNTSDILDRSISRKKSVVLTQLEKALDQMRGAVKYLKRDHRLKLNIGGVIREFSTEGRAILCLVVVKELFDDSYTAYGERLLEFIDSVEVPCLVFDYPQLHACTANLNCEEAFLTGYEAVLNAGLQGGVFPRLRFGLVE